MNETALVWFRRDLRLNDHPALARAADRFDTVVPVFADRTSTADWSPGSASRWWLRRSVDELRDRLRSRGLDLVIRTEAPADGLSAVADAVGADTLLFHRNHVPAGLDERVESAVADCGVGVEALRTRLLHEPSEIRTTSGGPYHVYTPFWNKFRDVVDVPRPDDAPDLDATLAPSTWPASAEPDELLAPSESFDGTPADYWRPGERGAEERLDTFVDGILHDYDDGRERPDRDGSSRLSPHLHFGELSPRTVWHRVADSAAADEAPEDAEVYLQELVWREFAYHMLVHYPETTDEPLRDKYADFPWDDNEELLDQWKRGETGYPLVDAGMRQLRETGWMHNRVRMVVASFLTKDLLIPWQRGAEWFWERLVDADLANNTMGWQWAAGSGADAQPFFRIFNPVSQSERHDPNGDYVREWVPELEGLEGAALHEPWTAEPQDLKAAGVILGKDYPEPIVDHGRARERALEAWEEIK